MGQMTHGILYGVEITAELSDDDDEQLDDALRELGADLVYVGGGSRTFCCLAGFWLAVGASDRDDVPLLKPAVEVGELVYSDRYKAVRPAWPRVLKAIAAVGVKRLPPPGLWIVAIEVA